MNFIFKILFLIVFLFPIVSFASTDEGYFAATRHYRPSGSGTILDSTDRLLEGLDYLSIYIKYDDYYIVNGNHGQWVSQVATNYTGITSIKVDYELDVVSGNCEFILHHGEASAGASSYVLYFNSSVDVARTVASTTVSRSDSQYLSPLLRQYSGSTCEATIKIYRIFDEDGNDYLNFTQPITNTVYVPVNTELSSLECINNSPTSTCSFTYATTSTTTSSNIDYSKHFDLFLLFVGISFFALAIHLFRGLALKYL